MPNARTGETVYHAHAKLLRRPGCVLHVLGRAAIDAQLSESSILALEKRERIAKQASFKAMSFVLGYFCDVLTTTLLLVPSKNGTRVDGIEIQRRIGLRRMRPSSPIPLLSVAMDPEDAAQENDIRLDTIGGDEHSARPDGFLLHEFSSKPTPQYEIVRDDKKRLRGKGEERIRVRFGAIATAIWVPAADEAAARSFAAAVDAAR